MTPGYRHWTQTSPAYRRYQEASNACDAAFAPIKSTAKPEKVNTEKRNVNVTNSQEPRATPAQVNRIMSLLWRREDDGDGGGWFSGPTTLEGVSRMTRANASRYINSLENTY